MVQCNCFSLFVVSLSAICLQQTKQQAVPGPPGDTGDTGPTGPAGFVGQWGFTGATGFTGNTGERGGDFLGSAGIQGATGWTGMTGPMGASGATGATGLQGPKGATGPTGSEQLNTTTTRPTTTTTTERTTITPCNGPIGPTGPQGAAGDAGATGQTGWTGYTGMPGFTGSTGSTGELGAGGPPGPMGQQGATGATGVPGVWGRVGATGATGDTGPAAHKFVKRQVLGCPGMKGPKGFPGKTGAIGATGQTGGTGLRGQQGFVGPTGEQQRSPGTGLRGPPGRIGVQGDTGNTGAMGSQGSVGATGVQGIFTVIVIPTPTIDSIDPLFGPVSGGTRVTLYGQFLNTSTVSVVRLGEYTALPDATLRTSSPLVVVSPPANETGRHLPITVELLNGKTVPTDRTFEYRDDPEFTDINPKQHLIIGGTFVTVSGRHFDSVSAAGITLTTVTTRFTANTRQLEVLSTSQSCTAQEAGSQLLCRMPRVLLPADIQSKLDLNDGQIIDPSSPGVAVYYGSNGRDRADIYLGFQLDSLYQNISVSNSTVKMQFYPTPTINCGQDVLQFNPSVDNIIEIKGSKLTVGCRLIDYTVSVGDSVCQIQSLTDNQLNCQPPATKPQSANNSLCNSDTLAVQVSVGNARYHCTCLQYTTNNKKVALIVGLTVGLCVPFILLVVIVIVLLLRRHRQQLASVHSPSRLNDTHENITDSAYIKSIVNETDSHSYDQVVSRPVEYKYNANSEYLTPVCDYENIYSEPSEELSSQAKTSPTC